MRNTAESKKKKTNTEEIVLRMKNSLRTVQWEVSPAEWIIRRTEGQGIQMI